MGVGRQAAHVCTCACMCARVHVCMCVHDQCVCCMRPSSLSDGDGVGRPARMARSYPTKVMGSTHPARLGWAPCTPPCTLHPAPCTMHHAPCMPRLGSLHASLLPAPCTLHPAPCMPRLGSARLARQEHTRSSCSGCTQCPHNHSGSLHCMHACLGH